MVRMRDTIAVIGEGITEQHYIKSILDIVAVKPKAFCPKNTGMKELEYSIKLCLREGFTKIFCLIDMDNKADDGQSAHITYRNDYMRLKQKYHNRMCKNGDGGKSLVIMLESYPSTELFFMYYFQYTTAYYTNEGLKLKLRDMCGYDTADRYLYKNPLHDTFEEHGGSLMKAIENSLKSIKARDISNSHASYTEIGRLFDSLGIR